MTDLVRTQYVAEDPMSGASVTVALGNDGIRMGTSRPTELFEAGERLIEAAIWLSKVRSARDRAKLEALANERKQES